MRALALFVLPVVWLSVARAQEAALPSVQEADELTAPSTEAILTQEGLEALGLEQSVPTVDTSLRFSGFADFTFGTLLVPKSSTWRSLNTAPPHTSFYLGNINLYLAKDLTKSLQMLGEVRFSYLPNGSSIYGATPRVSTAASDYTDFGRVTRWGGVVIERFYLDWIAHPLLTVRAGQFLTPYGVWNVDHGSPTYIPVRRPWSVGLGPMPQRQTGIELFGRWEGPSESAIGYHLTLSNGQGPLSEFWDMDENKAVGARLYWEYRALGQLRIGATGYYGRETDASQRVALTPAGLVGSETINVQFDTLALAADLVWKYRGLHVQSEWLFSQRAYTEDGRVAQQQPSGVPALPADQMTWGGYVLIGYRLPWLGIMPYYLVERVSFDVLGSQNETFALEGGLNVRPVDILVLKLSYHQVFTIEGLEEGDPLRVLQAQLAWAF